MQAMSVIAGKIDDLINKLISGPGKAYKKISIHNVFKFHFLFSTSNPFNKTYINLTLIEYSSQKIYDITQDTKLH
jgi:hypothetical protein